MMTLIGANIVPLILAFIIGIATGWWVWAQYGAQASARVDPDVATAMPTQTVPIETVPIESAPRVTVPSASPPPLIVDVPPAKPASFAKLPDVTVAAPPSEALQSDIVPTEDLPAVSGIAAAVAPPDDLLKLKGVGPKLNALLISLGVTRFDQIARWSADDIKRIDAQLGSFKGRIDRENWIEQAGLLASGSIAAFEAKFGKLDSENV